MKLLVVGGGGREHAIIKALKKNPAVEELFALPENEEPAVLIPIGYAADELKEKKRKPMDEITC